MGVTMEAVLKDSPHFEAYKSLFNYNHEACYALDLNGNIHLFNDAAVKLTGYSHEEALQMSFYSLLAEDYLENGRQIFRTLLEGNSEKVVTRINHKNGYKIDLEITAIPIYHNKKICGIVGVCKDITEQKKIETFLTGQNHILEKISKGTSFLTVLDSIVALIEEVSNGGRSAILLLDETKENLIVGSAPNLPSEFWGLLNAKSFVPPLESYKGDSNPFIFVSDIENNPLWSEFKDVSLKHGLRYCWYAPVFDTQNELLALFSLFYDEYHSLTSLDKLFIEKAIYLTSLVIQHYYAEEKLNLMSYYDELTGLPNRRMFDEKVKNIIKQYQNSGNRMFGVLFFDLDRFKQINDIHGQHIGDLLLVEVAQRLRGYIREQDSVYRWSGDEFILLLNDVSKDEVEKITERIINELSTPFFIKGLEIYMSPGIGISLFPHDGESVDELLRKADAAMYQAKKEGRNNYQFFNPIHDIKTRETLEIENELRKALKKKEFILYYQPIIDLTTNKVSAVEALIRWEHPRLGKVSPERFIPIAEETGMILQIGEWVLTTACNQVKQWQDSGIDVPAMSVNISFRQFYQPNLVEMIAQMIDETGINPSSLTIEITESMTMDVEAATRILYSLKNLGVNISIDDFGTGYSSFSYLKKFPIDYLKIDKSFIRDIAKSKDDENIATSILLMAQKLGLNVIAEGVETYEQLEVLRQNHCNKAQGFLFSKPVTAEGIQGMLASITVASKHVNFR